MENNVNCTVIEFESDGDMLKCLGMSDERANFLIKKLMHSFIDEDRYTAMIARASKYCNHPNELAFVCMHVGKLAAKKAGQGSIDISQLFGFN